jgi:hypothetical protein
MEPAILSDKTNNTARKIDDDDAKRVEKYKIKMKLISTPPIPLEDLKLCDTGLIQTGDERPVILSDKYNVGEFADVYCVAAGVKPLAGLDFSERQKRDFYSTLDIPLINGVIKYVYNKGLRVIRQIDNRGGDMYLNTIAYIPANKDNAYKLMGILWLKPETLDFTEAEYQYIIGKLLGYAKSNIIYFIKSRVGVELSDSDIEIVEKKLESFTVSLDDLNREYDSVKNTKHSKTFIDTVLSQI